MVDKAKIRIPQLSTVIAVGNEFAKLYRAVRHGKLDSAEAYRMGQLLLGLKACLETGTIEKDIAEIKEALENRPSERTYKLAS